MTRSSRVRLRQTATPNAQEAAANALPEHPLLGLRLFVMRFDSEGGCRELTDWFIER
jgi:hypothetical protein